MDSRAESVDKKIARLDAELKKYKDQVSLVALAVAAVVEVVVVVAAVVEIVVVEIAVVEVAVVEAVVAAVVELNHSDTSRDDRKVLVNLNDVK